MASIAESGMQPPVASPSGVRRLAGVLVLLAAVGAAVVAYLMYQAGAFFGLSIAPVTDWWLIGSIAASVVLLLIGGAMIFARPGLGGGIALTGTIAYLWALLVDVTFGGYYAVPLVLGAVGSLTALVSNDRLLNRSNPRIIYRQSIFTRVTHWTWAIAMFFLLLTGLQIWNAHPALYIGQQSGFEFENAIFEINAENTPNGPRGFTTVLGQKFDTTGVLGMSGTAARPEYIGFPGWATIPSFRDLATGRVIHFFFAWILVGALAVWLIASLANRHLWRDIILKPRDFRDLPKDILDHIKLRFHHTRTYSPLQKLAYFVVFVILFPLIILTGLTMSPGMDAAWPWLLDIFGGRQTARTLHFLAMVGLTLFFVVHIIMVVLAGPINELRSMITGYYKTSKVEPDAVTEEKAK